LAEALSGIMLCVTFSYCYAECRGAPINGAPTLSITARGIAVKNATLGVNDYIIRCVCLVPFMLCRVFIVIPNVVTLNVVAR
jgi:hypothetical protein